MISAIKRGESRIADIFSLGSKIQKSGFRRNKNWKNIFCEGEKRYNLKFQNRGRKKLMKKYKIFIALIHLILIK